MAVKERYLFPRPHMCCPHCDSDNDSFILDEGDRFLRKCNNCNNFFYEPILRKPNLRKV